MLREAPSPEAFASPKDVLFRAFEGRLPSPWKNLAPLTHSEEVL